MTVRSGLPARRTGSALIVAGAVAAATTFRSGAAGAQTGSGPSPNPPSPNTEVQVPQGKAAAAAVVNQYLGGRTGFCNPARYRVACGPRSPFQPLGTPGQIFNPGSGLGVPDLAALAADFGRQ